MPALCLPSYTLRSQFPVSHPNPGQSNGDNRETYFPDWHAGAVALEPVHRGANSYLGVAYVRTNDLTKARAQLAKLESICGNEDCDEYKLRDKAIADYKPQ